VKVDTDETEESTPVRTSNGPRQERDRRWFVIGLVTVVAAELTWQRGIVRTRPSDFEQTWQAARFLWQGLNPYDLIGPGQLLDWPFPYLYPLTAAVALAPMTLVPIRVAEVLFVSLSAAVLAWALTRTSSRNPQLWVFASWAFLFTAETVQWGPLMIASALIPSLGFLLMCKPTIGAALWLAYPSWRSASLAVGFGIATVAIWPWWVPAWVGVLDAGWHVVAPIMLTGGPLVCLALLKWRRPEARLLVALACMPHTVALHEAAPLFLVVRRSWEGAMLSALTLVTWLIADFGSERNVEELAAWRAQAQLWCLYAPCLAMVLRRPNVAPPDDRLANVLGRLQRVRELVRTESVRKEG
jgi:hypothetical protein